MDTVIPSREHGLDEGALDRAWRRLDAYLQTRTPLLHRVDARKIARLLCDFAGSEPGPDHDRPVPRPAALPQWAREHTFESQRKDVVARGRRISHFCAMEGNLMDTLFWSWQERGGAGMGERYKADWISLIQWAARAGFSATQVHAFGAPLNNMAIMGGVAGLKALQAAGVGLSDAGPDGRTAAHTLALAIGRDDSADRVPMPEARRAQHAATLRWLADAAPGILDKRDAEGRTPRSILGERFAYVLEPERAHAETPIPAVPAGVLPGVARSLR